ncbi:hypothetical protein QTP88_006542 [Uroleucon formosanum]
MSISIDVLGMCRICLNEEDLLDVLLLGEPTSQWMMDINRYFGVQLTFHEDKSTKICFNCILKIENWRNDMKTAANCQNIINFLDRELKKQEREEEMEEHYDSDL